MPSFFDPQFFGFGFEALQTGIHLCYPVLTSGTDQHMLFEDTNSVLRKYAKRKTLYLLGIRMATLLLLQHKHN